MKHISKVLTYLILAVNVFFTGMLLLTAYSPYLHPEAHPIASCLGLAFPIFLLINACFFLFWLIVNFRFAALSLLGFILCGSQIHTYIPFNFKSKNIPEESIKILSYNVMGFNGLKKDNITLDYLSESDADVICIQEFGFSEAKKHLTIKDIKKKLKAYSFYKIETIGNGSNRLACFSKFPILSADRIKYKSAYNGSVIYQLKMNEDTLTLINNHLESNKLTYEDKIVYEDMLKDPNAKKVKSGLRQLVRKLAEASAIRSRQAEAVAEIIKSSPNPIIVCGDFNDAPISYTHRIMAQDLDDAFTQSGRGLGISYNQNKFYFRIDNILISKDLKSYNCTVDESIKESDHYPIWCYIAKR